MHSPILLKVTQWTHLILGCLNVLPSHQRARREPPPIHQEWSDLVGLSLGSPYLVVSALVRCITKSSKFSRGKKILLLFKNPTKTKGSWETGLS
jgi:hypothetical protein